MGGVAEERARRSGSSECFVDRASVFQVGVWLLLLGRRCYDEDWEMSGM